MHSDKYTEIFRLRDMLESEVIPHVFKDSSSSATTFVSEHYQIQVFDHASNERLISVIEGYGTYGSEDDKLEIMGLLTEEEKEMDSVAGWLTAEDIFQRIKNALASPAQTPTNRPPHI